METLTIPTRLDIRARQIGYPLADYLGFDSRRDTSLQLHEHTHKGYEITYVFQGTVLWQLRDGTDLKLNGGDMALTQPGVVHKGYLDIIQPATIFWLSTANLALVKRQCCGLTAEEIGELDAVLGRAGNRVWFADEPFRRSLILLYRQLGELQSSESPSGRRLLMAGARGLITHVLTLCARIASAGVGARSMGEYVQAARAYMRDHLGEEISVNDVARRVGVSVSRMHAIFKEESGLTPNDYLQRLRVETAQQLLGSSQTPVTQIALDVGFSSSQYFATCFRKYTGMTPRQFRGRGR
jgi:AraC-like DNA-binding protein